MGEGESISGAGVLNLFKIYLLAIPCLIFRCQRFSSYATRLFSSIIGPNAIYLYTAEGNTARKTVSMLKRSLLSGN